MVIYLTTDFDQTDKKLMFPSTTSMKLTSLIENVRKTLLIDFSLLKEGIEYSLAKPLPEFNIKSIKLYNETFVEQATGNATPVQILELKRGQLNNRVSSVYYAPLNGDDRLPFVPPFYTYLAEGETETDEVVTDTIVFPPPETHEEWTERISARLLHFTRRIRGLRHEEPHQNALSENICQEVPNGHDELERYDHSCNLIKRPVGWLGLQMESYEKRYHNYLNQVKQSKEDGTAPPADFDISGRQPVEAMLEKLEGNITEDLLQDHFDRHNIAEWKRVQRDERKITLCNPDDHSPGEVLVDVNSYFTDGDGNMNEAAKEHAIRTYHEISTKYWVMSKRTPHRELVTERTVTLPE